MWFQRNTIPDNIAMWPIAFASKSLTSAEAHCNKTERQVLGILYGLEKFHHFFFAYEVHMIISHQLLVAILKKTLQAYHIGFKEYYYRYTSTTSEYYRNQDHNYSSNIGYSGTTMKQIGMKKYQTCT